MKLISMTDYLMELTKNNFIGSGDVSNEILLKAKNYANFLKQPLKLEMFVPCDEDGNVLVEPYNDGNGDNYFGVLLDEYQKAKEKVLFEGFEIETNREGEKVILGDYTCLKVSDLENKTIEDLVKYVHIKLTERAIKRIFG